MKQIRTFTISLVFCLSGILPAAKAQISLSPSFVFIDSRTGVGDLFVSNTSEKDYEISISFVFGYPDSDSTGNVIMNYNDPEAGKEYSLDSMVRAFPRNFLLAGNEQRTVRLQLVPAARGKEGFYFTRMKVMARPKSAEIATQVNENVATVINFNFEQVTAVFYYKGNVSTGIEVQDVNFSQLDSTLHLLVNVERTGNAPYIGTMYAKLKDQKNRVVAESQSSVSIYFDVIRSMDIDLAEVPPANYKLELSFETHRKDIKDKNLVQAAKFVKEQQVMIR
jgi:hypothetical protein